VKFLHASVVIFPGLDGTGELTSDFAADDWCGLTVRVIAIPKYGAQDYPSLVQQITPQLPDGPLILIGESFSSPLVMKLAEQERQRMIALVIIGGFCCSPVSAAMALIPVRPLFLIRPPAAALRKFLAGPAAPQELISRISTAIRSVPSAILAERLRAILTLEENDCPAPDGVPTLLLQAKQDALIPWETQSRLERHFTQPTVTWIDSPHLLLATHPEACREAVLSFLREQN
jgi:pimeloyl-[acyl-carrier protein] methyl ester esterase